MGVWIVARAMKERQACTVAHEGYLAACLTRSWRVVIGSSLLQDKMTVAAFDHRAAVAG